MPRRVVLPASARPAIPTTCGLLTDDRNREILQAKWPAGPWKPLIVCGEIGWTLTGVPLIMGALSGIHNACAAVSTWEKAILQLASVQLSVAHASSPASPSALSEVASATKGTTPFVAFIA